jgi:hypothetical protein
MPATKKARGDFSRKLIRIKKPTSAKADIAFQLTRGWRVSGSGFNYTKGFVIELDLPFIQNRETLLH